MTEIDPTVELANLEQANANKIGLLAIGHFGKMTTIPSGFLENIEIACYLEHLLRATGVETAAKLDFQERVSEVLAELEDHARGD